MSAHDLHWEEERSGQIDGEYTEAEAERLAELSLKRRMRQDQAMRDGLQHWMEETGRAPRVIADEVEE